MNPARTLLQARLMITFVRIVEAGSVSAAASRLGVDKGSVSRQLSSLEEMLGVRLLNRTTRSLSLTDVGQVVLERARRVLAEVESAGSEAESFRVSPSGVLNVSTSVAFGRTQIVPYMARFMARYPEIEVNLCLQDRHVNLVGEGMDVVLRLCDQPPDALVAHRLSAISYVLVAVPAFAEQLRSLGAPSDLAEVPCLFYSYRKRETSWTFRRGAEFKSVTVRTRVAVNSSDAIRSLTLDGLGVALLPRFAVAKDLHEGTLVALLPGYEPQGNLGSSLYALHAPSRLVPPKVRSFIKFLREELTPTPAWELWRSLKQQA
jgi:DNA-binding transcriptional LysR family regulator